VSAKTECPKVFFTQRIVNEWKQLPSTIYRGPISLHVLADWMSSVKKRAGNYKALLVKPIIH